MNPEWTLRTGRLILQPVTLGDYPDLCRIKGDARVYAQMLGGVCGPARVLDELAEDIAFWGRYGAGMWCVRDHAHVFHGITGMMHRKDGRGTALRFAFWPEARGRGLAREAAGAALRFAHDVAGFGRIIGVAREQNFGSRMVLGSIGMVPCDSFHREGYRLIVYESLAGLRPVRLTASCG